MAASLQLTQAGSWLDTLVSCLVLAVLLWTLYLFNDLIDRAADRHNPRKELAVVSAYDAAVGVYWSLWVGGSVLCAILAYWHTSLAAPWVCGVIAVNVAYSMRLKAVAWLDLLAVGAWGAAYTAVATSNASLCLMVGCMTMIAHVYQTFADRVADGAQGIVTTAVRAPRAARALITGLAAVMAVLVAWAGGPLAAILLAICVAAPIWLFKSNQAAWHGSRVIFGACWLTMLGTRVAV